MANRSSPGLVGVAVEAGADAFGAPDVGDAAAARNHGIGPDRVWCRRRPGIPFRLGGHGVGDRGNLPVGLRRRRRRYGVFGEPAHIRKPFRIRRGEKNSQVRRQGAVIERPVPVDRAPHIQQRLSEPHFPVPLVDQITDRNGDERKNDNNTRRHNKFYKRKTVSQRNFVIR